MTPPPEPPAADVVATSEAVRRVMIAVACCGAVLTAGAAMWVGSAVAVSVGLGVAVALANLFVLARVVMALLGGGGQAGGWGLVALFKFGALFVGMWALFSSGLALVMPFIVGYGALPIGITLGSLFLGSSTSSTEANGS